MARLLCAFVLFLIARGALGLEGLVVDGQGKPVQGADVYLLERGPRNETPIPKARTSAEGKFRIKVPVPEPEAEWKPFSGQVLVIKEGFALANADLLDEESDEESVEPLYISLERPRRVTIRAVDTPGRPLAGARAWVHYLQGPVHAWCGALHERLAVTLDRDGTAELAYLPAQCAFAITVSADALGRQTQFFSTDATDFTVRFRPMGQVAGQVLADDPRAVKGLDVSVISNGFDTVNVKTDAAGKFETSVPTGRIHCYVTANRQFPFRVTRTADAELKAGQTAEVQLKLERGIRAFGTVVDDKTSRPIEGALMVVGTDHVRTNREGKYEAFVGTHAVWDSAGKQAGFQVHVSKAPGLYMVGPYTRWRTEVVQAGAKEHEVPTIRLKPGFDLSGVVVDEQDRPVAGARIDAVWMETDGQTFSSSSKSTRSGADGRFRLKPVPGDVELALIAVSDDRATGEMVVARSGQPAPVSLTVRPEAAVTVAGRVVDGQGQPVAGAKVQIRKGSRMPSKKVWNWGVLRLRGRQELRTTADGSFVTPVKLARSEPYSLVVEAPDMVGPGAVALAIPAQGDPFRVPDIVLHRQRSAAGIVLDAKDKPLVKAVVWSHGVERGRKVRTETGEDGKFRLDRLHPEARFLFVEKERFRFGGALVSKSGEVRLTLESKESPSSQQPLRSVHRTRDQQARLLKELILPVFPRLISSYKADALKRLLAFDREIVLERLGEIGPEQQVELLATLGELDDALAQAVCIKDPYSRVYKIRAVADAVSDAKRKKEILTEALVHARKIEQPDHRTVALAGIAERLFDAGHREDARRVLDEGKKTAEQLATTDWSGFARGHFAENLALVDAPAALKLLDAFRRQSSEFTRHAGNVAHELAAIQPAEAERVHGMLQEISRASYAVRVCYRMASVDPRRAERIVESLKLYDDPRFGLGQKAHAYGVMAVAIAKKDPETARRWLRSAFEELSKARVEWPSDDSVFPFGLALLGFSEVVDPQSTRAYFWRALSLHPGPTFESWSPERQEAETQENTCKLVLLLGLYGQFPELQAELMRPIFARWDRAPHGKKLDFYRQDAAFAAMALADPQRAIKWHAEFHAKADKESLRLHPQPWMTLADVFGSQGQELHNRLVQSVFHLWVIDKEDL